MSDERTYTEWDVVERERRAFTAGARWRFERSLNPAKPYLTDAERLAAAATAYPLPTEQVTP